MMSGIGWLGWVLDSRVGIGNEEAWVGRHQLEWIGKVFDMTSILKTKGF